MLTWAIELNILHVYGNYEVGLILITPHLWLAKIINKTSSNPIRRLWHVEAWNLPFSNIYGTPSNY